jgi:hypothetical protein
MFASRGPTHCHSSTNPDVASAEDPSKNAVSPRDVDHDWEYWRSMLQAISATPSATPSPMAVAIRYNSDHDWDYWRTMLRATPSPTTIAIRNLSLLVALRLPKSVPSSDAAALPLLWTAASGELFQRYSTFLQLLFFCFFLPETNSTSSTMSPLWAPPDEAAILAKKKLSYLECQASEKTK